MSRTRVTIVVAVTLLAALLAPAAWARTLYGACDVASSYDMTLVGNTLVFQRRQAAPRRVVFGKHGALRIDGAPVSLDHEGQDRAALFARGVHALVPKARDLATRAVNVAARSLRSEAGDDAASIDAQARQVKARIARSRTTRDWHGAAFQNYLQQQELQLGKALAAPLARQALQAAMSGNLQKAEALRARASNLAGNLPDQLRSRLSVLQPQLEALCTRARHLARLQAGIRLPSSGRPLDLITLQKPASGDATQ